MEVEEHFYTEDISIGPPDARTLLNGVHYFFIGNGHICAAIQVCDSEEATPIGLLIMHPEIFGPKRKVLNFNPETGIADSQLQICDVTHDDILENKPIDFYWDERRAVPTVVVKRRNELLSIEERFYCPDLSSATITREIYLQNHSNHIAEIKLKTGNGSKFIENIVTLKSGDARRLFIEYRLVASDSGFSVGLSWMKEQQIADEAQQYWEQITQCKLHRSTLDHLFAAAKNQIRANVAASGRMDASIWQYNLEWVRDQSMVVVGLTVSGQFEIARTMLERILREFVTPEGDTVDSGKIRPKEEVELDQNGELLFALKTYVDWSGDLNIVKEHWNKIEAAANFPLDNFFRHPEAVLLCNRREYWERHALYGIENGMELAYQFYVSVGLQCAASLARLLGYGAKAKIWSGAASKIKDEMLYNSKFALVEKQCFIKRRKIDGEIQEEVFVGKDTGLPEGIPILEKGQHFLNPDSSTALPIAFEFIDPCSELAAHTLNSLELLWNQRWETGGYSRYNVTSEPDSPGPWPFASLFIARAYLESGDYEKVWRVLDWLLTLPGGKAGTWFEFYGPRPIPPCPQIGIVPWTWAEILVLFVHHILGVRPGWNKLHLRPRLLTGLRQVEASVRLRNMRLDMRLRFSSQKERAGFWIDGQYHEFSADGIIIDFPQNDLAVEVILPGF